MIHISTLVVFSSAAVWADKFSSFGFQKNLFCPLTQWIYFVLSVSQVSLWKTQALKMHLVVHASLPRETACKY